MSKQVCLLLFLLSFWQVQKAKAQDLGAKKVEAEIRVGYGSFAMHKVRLLMQSTIAGNPFPLKVVDDYPSFIVYSVQLTLPINEKVRLGFSMGSASTGSRAHYQDYSGEYRVDHLLTSIDLAVMGEYSLKSFAKDKLNIAMFTGLGVIFTTFTAKSYLQINSFEDEDKAYLSAESISIEPGLKAKYHFTKMLYAGAAFSYLFDTQGKLHAAGNRQLYIIGFGSKPYKADWSGGRAKLFIGIRF